MGERPKKGCTENPNGKASMLSEPHDTNSKWQGSEREGKQG